MFLVLHLHILLCVHYGLTILVCAQYLSLPYNSKTWLSLYQAILIWTPVYDVKQTANCVTAPWRSWLPQSTVMSQWRATHNTSKGPEFDPQWGSFLVVWPYFCVNAFLHFLASKRHFFDDKRCVCMLAATDGYLSCAKYTYSCHRCKKQKDSAS